MDGVVVLNEVVSATVVGGGAVEVGMVAVVGVTGIILGLVVGRVALIVWTLIVVPCILHFYESGALILRRSARSKHKGKCEEV